MQWSSQSSSSLKAKTCTGLLKNTTGETFLVYTDKPTWQIKQLISLCTSFFLILFPAELNTDLWQCFQEYHPPHFQNPSKNLTDSLLNWLQLIAPAFDYLTQNTIIHLILRSSVSIIQKQSWDCLKWNSRFHSFYYKQS